MNRKWIYGETTRDIFVENFSSKGRNDRMFNPFANNEARYECKNAVDPVIGMLHLLIIDQLSTQVTATDGDKDRPQDIVYFLTGQGIDPDNPANSKFDINRTSGEIYVLKVCYIPLRCLNKINPSNMFIYFHVSVAQIIFQYNTCRTTRNFNVAC